MYREREREDENNIYIGVGGMKEWVIAKICH